MLLMFTQEKIISGLTRAVSIIPPKASAAYLSAIWIKADEPTDTVSFCSTDSNIEFAATFEADVKESGICGVNGKNFFDLIKRCPEGDIRLRLTNSETQEDAKVLEIKQGRRLYNLPCNEAAWFQEPNAFPDKFVVWEGDFFKNVIDHVSFCISNEEIFDAIGCLYMHAEKSRVSVCALNGHQFAKVDFLHDELATFVGKSEILIPRKYTQNIRRILGNNDLDIATTEKRFFLRSSDGSEMLSVPTSREKYPDYSAFLARLNVDTVSHMRIVRKDMLASLERIAVFNSDGGETSVFFDLTENEITLTAEGNTIGKAKEILDMEYDGKLKRIAFPTKNLIEILSHFQSYEITLTFTNEEGPCSVTGNDDANDQDYTVLVMPMKLTDRYYENGKQTSSEKSDESESDDDFVDNEIEEEEESNVD